MNLDSYFQLATTAVTKCVFFFLISKSSVFFRLSICISIAFIYFSFQCSVFILIALSFIIFLIGLWLLLVPSLINSPWLMMFFFTANLLPNSLLKLFSPEGKGLNFQMLSYLLDFNCKIDFIADSLSFDSQLSIFLVPLSKIQFFLKLNESFLQLKALLTLMLSWISASVLILLPVKTEYTVELAKLDFLSPKQSIKDCLWGLFEDNYIYFFIKIIHIQFRSAIPSKLKQNRMKDQQLYNLIKKAVRQKKKIPHHAQSKKFAESYCEDQLKRKFYNNRSHQKMGMLMKNFKQLETYFDLPQLVKEIRQLKSKQIEENKMKSLKKIENKGEVQAQNKNVESKNYSNLKNLRSSIENNYTKIVLDSIQNNNIWKSQLLKNNSSYHMSSIEEVLKDYKDKQGSSQIKKMFDNLQIFLKNQKQFILHQKSHGMQQNKTDSDEKKEATQFLHKVSSYLQIILQKQHKNKWNRQRKSSTLKPKNFDLTKYSKSHYISLKKTKNSPHLITEGLSPAECIETLKSETKLVKPQPQKPQRPKYVIKKPTKILINGMPALKEKLTKNSRFKDLSNNQTVSTGNDTIELMRKQTSLIKQKFTFRRRSIKEKIIKKLDKFIDEIDDQTISSKKQNTYYNSQINKLENNLKKLFNRFRKETLADQKQIQNIKRLAQQFSVLASNKKTPPFNSENSFPTEKRLQGREICEKYSYQNPGFSQFLF